MTSFPNVDLAARISLILPQYGEAEKLKGLISGTIGVAEEQVSDLLERLDRGANPDESSGAVLDWIGRRIGMERPVIPIGEYLGYEGTDPSGGNPFDREEFYDDVRAIEQVAPLGDVDYRLLLKARARRLRGGANRETIEAVLAILWPTGRGYVDESSDPVVLVVTAVDDILFRLVDVPITENSVTVHHLVIPRPAGVRIVFRRTTREGHVLTWNNNPLTWNNNHLTWGS